MANDMTPFVHGSFDLTRFLEGPVTAWGVFQDRFGRVRKRFSVQMVGRWSGPSFIIDERFVYDDSTEERRVWSLEPRGPGRFVARSAACIGEARGHSTSDQATMRYKFRLELKNGPLTVDFDDRIFRIDDYRAINRATIRKWGVRLGELTLWFERADAPRLAAA
ncbi:MAG: DUF3833 family protein [Hyphomicrobiaceae bacterium]